MSARAQLILCACATLLVGCSPDASVLDPRGESASDISSLFWLFAGVCAFVWLMVTAALFSGLRARGAPAAPLPLDDRREKHDRLKVVIAVGATTMIIVGLTVVSFFVDRRVARIGGATPRLTIEITGRQWWWEARPAARPYFRGRQ